MTAIPKATPPVRQRLAQLWNGAVTSYYLLAGASLLLVGLGLLMVLSSSSVSSLQATEGKTPFDYAGTQLLFACVGLVAAYIASRLPIVFYRRVAIPVLLGGMFLQVLVVFTNLGAATLGNRNWLVIGPLRFQPSEFIKVGLVLFLGVVLARHRHQLHRWRHIVFPGGIMAGAATGLVLLGHDLGTALVMIGLIAGAFFMAGMPMRMFGMVSVLALVAVVYLAQSSGSRVTRIKAFFSPHCDVQNECLQTAHGLVALGSGGVFGQGLGASREKWMYLPEAHNDFIFAIVGEELGLIGTMVVLILFTALAVAMIRIIRRSQDPFVKIATGSAMVWILGQAMINLSVVVGFLPVIGVPLPLVSYGGSALIVTLCALGMLLAFARNEPGAAQALAARGRVVRRSLAVVSPGR